MPQDGCTKKNMSKLALSCLLGSCLLPTLDLGTRWDAISTLLNVTGALFTGLASGIATQRNSAALARLIPCFQGGFVGVWTSFAFMAEHGAEIAWESPTRFRRAASYMAASLACGLGANWVGFRLGRDVAALGGAAVRIAASSWLPRLLAAVVVGCVARAFLSLSGLPRFPKGWVSDPANPQFRGMKEVQSLHRDWKEILTGLAYATLAVVTGVVMPLTGVAMPLTGVVVAQVITSAAGPGMRTRCCRGARSAATSWRWRSWSAPST